MAQAGGAQALAGVGHHPGGAPGHAVEQRRRRLAQAELETLSRQIAGSNFLLAFADREGVILDLYADNRFSMSAADAGIVAGPSTT